VSESLPGNELKNSSRVKNRWLIQHVVTIFLLALLIRGFYLYDSRDNPTFRLSIVDARTYDQIARGILETGKLTQDLFWQPPFYPLFLTGVYSFTKGSILSVKIFQMILGALTCVLVYLLGARILNRKIGLLAGIITAFYMPLVFFEGELLATGWAAFWPVVILLLLLKTTERPGILHFLFLGFCGALSILTRPVFLPFFLASCLWLIFVLYRQKKLRFTLQRASIIAAGFLIVAIPTGILGFSTTGKFRILPFSGGINLYLGNNPNFKETTTIRPGLAWEKLLRLPEREGIESIYEKDAFFREEALGFMLKNPLKFTKGLVHKTSQFFSSRELARNVDMYVFRKWSNMLRIGVWKVGKFGFPYALLFALAVMGAAFWIRRIPLPIWLFLALYPAAVILVFVTSRYRMPVVPVMSLLASGGIVAFWEMTLKRHWPKLAILSAIFLISAVGCSSFGPFPEERLNFKAELHNALGVVLQEMGHPEKAKKAYLNAIQSRDDFVDAYYNLGVLMEKQGKTNQAMDYYHQAIKADPQSTNPYYNLGVLFQFQGKTDESIRYFLQTLKLEPSDAYAHNNLGNALRSRGQLDRAIEHYRLALKYKPSYDAAINNLGYALLRQGNMDEAAVYFQKALEIQPSWPPALTGLARILATHPDPKKRDPEKAISLGEQAAKITGYKEPIVLNILAMAYAASGNLSRAVNIAERALEIALASGNQGLASQIKKNLDLYKKGKYCGKSSGNSPGFREPRSCLPNQEEFRSLQKRQVKTALTLSLKEGAPL